jgi:hypothetical protein
LGIAPPLPRTRPIESARHGQDSHSEVRREENCLGTDEKRWEADLATKKKEESGEEGKTISSRLDWVGLG